MFPSFTPGEYRNMHQARVLREDIIDDSFDAFVDVLAERCSLKSKALDNAFTETKGRTIRHQVGDLDTYSSKDAHLPLQNISLGGQREEELIVEVGLEMLTKESNWLLKSHLCWFHNDHGLYLKQGCNVCFTCFQ